MLMHGYSDMLMEQAPAADIAGRVSRWRCY
jgi:hypothetical protein